MTLSPEQQNQVNGIAERLFKARKYPEPQTLNGVEITGDVFYSDIHLYIKDIVKPRTVGAYQLRNEAFCQVCDQLRKKGFKLFS